LNWHDNDSVARFQFSCPQLGEIGLGDACHVVSSVIAGACRAGHGPTIARAAGSCTRLHSFGQFLLFVPGFSSGSFFERWTNRSGAGWIQGRCAGTAVGQNLWISLGKQFGCLIPSRMGLRHHFDALTQFSRNCPGRAAGHNKRSAYPCSSHWRAVRPCVIISVAARSLPIPDHSCNSCTCALHVSSCLWY